MRLFLPTDSFVQRINGCNELLPNEVTALVHALKCCLGQTTEERPPIFRAVDLRELKKKIEVLRINGTNLEMYLEGDALKVSPPDSSI
ncbi:MAG: hypothetical protein NUV54_00855 [Candidatus Taylorbacteria bacterium]|nr:hypothetical protein [Candidatus Taylorbacteria bacterium]